MKKLIAVLTSIFFSGCATMYYEDIQRDQLAVQSYFQSPKDALLIHIYRPDGGVSYADCHMNNFVADSFHGASGEFRLPYSNVLDMKAPAQEIRTALMKLTEEQREQELLQLSATPIILGFTCQNHLGGHLKAEAYYDGKLIASDSTTLMYGVVTLSASIPLAETVRQ